MCTLSKQLYPMCDGTGVRNTQISSMFNVSYLYLWYEYTSAVLSGCKSTVFCKESYKDMCLLHARCDCVRYVWLLKVRRMHAIQ